MKENQETLEKYNKIDIIYINNPETLYSELEGMSDEKINELYNKTINELSDKDTLKNKIITKVNIINTNNLLKVLNFINTLC